VESLYDLVKLKEIPISEICSMYGIKLERKGGRLWGKIRNENTSSFCINEARNRWQDFGTNEKGDSIQLVAYLDRVDRAKAIHILASRFGIENEITSQIMPTPKQFMEIGINSERVISNFIIDLEKQNIEQLEKWDKKYSMSIYDLSKHNLKMYHKILDSRALPIIYDKKKYFSYLLETYKNTESELDKQLYKAKLEEAAASINKKVDIYNKARLDKNKKQYLKVKLNIIKNCGVEK
jgi:hypothetical protein